MKFLIAASFLCFALVGQIQGGSLRGYEVRVPHVTYGAPAVEAEDSSVIEAAKVEEPVVPSVEYGAPALIPAIQSTPYVDSLPLVDSFVHFNTPSEVYGPPAIPKPELPYLQPGLPALPAAPEIPVELPVEMPIREVSNTYLPPVKEIPTTPAPIIEEPVRPSETYGPPAETYLPPATPEIVDIPALPEIPSTPATPIVEDVREEGYHYAPPTPETPKVTVPEPSVIYGPPVVAHQPAVVQVHIEPVHIPTVSHFVPVVPEAPIAVPVETVKQGYSYNRPTKDFPTPAHVSSAQNLAASTSSFQVNNIVVPGLAHPTATDDSIIVHDLKPSFAIHSVSGNTHKTSVGTFNHVSFVNREVPFTSSFGGFLPLVKDIRAHATF